VTIKQLDLEPIIEAKARSLMARHPGVVFTSGRRSAADQAYAMAGNIVSSGNRRWIAETYRDGPAIRHLQQWVDAHPEATTRVELSGGLFSVLTSMPAEERSHVSRHLAGMAFDVRPHSCPFSALEALEPVQLLSHEGDAERWHCGW
jgi:hypothetical protein